METGRGAADVVGGAAARLLKVAPADIRCAVLLDPSTLPDTGSVHESGFPERVMPRLSEIEHGEQDGVDNLRTLTRRAAPLSSLKATAGGAIESGTYYRDILQPLDMTDELRILLRERGRTWGPVVLCRSTDSAPFGNRDPAAARAFGAPTTRAVRRSLATLADNFTADAGPAACTSGSLSGSVRITGHGGAGCGRVSYRDDHRQHPMAARPNAATPRPVRRCGVAGCDERRRRPGEGCVDPPATCAC